MYEDQMQALRYELEEVKAQLNQAKADISFLQRFINDEFDYISKLLNQQKETYEYNEKENDSIDLDKIYRALATQFIDTEMDARFESCNWVIFESDAQKTYVKSCKSCSKYYDCYARAINDKIERIKEIIKEA